MPPEQSSIRSSVCLHRYLLPASGKDEPGCRGIPEAVMPGQAAGPAVGRDRSPTLLPTVVLEATVGRDRFPTVAPTVALWTSVGRGLFPTDGPTVVLHATVARGPFPTAGPTVAPPLAPRPDVGRHGSPTVVSRATVGRDRSPTVAPTVAWRPCLARPSSSFSRSASVFAAAARIPLYTAPVREPVIRGNKRCIKRGEEKRGLAILKRYLSGNNGISLPRGVRATERRTAQSISVTSMATGTLKEG
jgi:hypothetical protein